MHTRTRYLPMEMLHAGMAVAQAVKDDYQRTLLPAGVTLTEENIPQLQAHGVELVCVSYPDPRSTEEIALQTAAATRAVMDIFQAADLTQPVTAALLQQVLHYRSA